MPREQVAMARTRYDLAATYSKGNAVLEVACGTGFGLDYLAGSAAFLVGGDLDRRNLELARRHVSGAVLTRFDAHSLPYRSGSFDTVLLFEALYYFADPALVLRECHRVLRPSGHLVLAISNPARRGFHPSPHSVRYFEADELEELLESTGYEAELFGAYDNTPRTSRQRILIAVTDLARRLHLVPATLRGRARVKSIFYGRLKRFDGLRRTDIQGEPLVPLRRDDVVASFKNLYGVGLRRDGATRAD